MTARDVLCIVVLIGGSFLAAWLGQRAKAALRRRAAYTEEQT